MSFDFSLDTQLTKKPVILRLNIKCCITFFNLLGIRCHDAIMKVNFSKMNQPLVAAKSRNGGHGRKDGGQFRKCK